MTILEPEIWVPWQGLEGRFYISNHGRVKSNYKVRKLRKSGAGYNDISIHNFDGEARKSVSVHVVVALHFVPNPENKPLVNHLDGDKTNNYYKNLRWATYSENIQHSYDFLGHKGAPNMSRRKTVVLIGDHGERRIVKGVREAGRVLGLPYQSIQQAINRKIKAGPVKVEYDQS